MPIRIQSLVSKERENLYACTIWSPVIFKKCDFPSLTWVIQEAYKVVLGNVSTLAFLSNSVHVPVIEACRPVGILSIVSKERKNLFACTIWSPSSKKFPFFLLCPSIFVWGKKTPNGLLQITKLEWAYSQISFHLESAEQFIEENL